MSVGQHESGAERQNAARACANKLAKQKGWRPAISNNIPVQIRETPAAGAASAAAGEHEETFESSGYEDDDDAGAGAATVGGADNSNDIDDDSTDSEYGAGAGPSDTSTACGRTRKHLMDVGGKIGSFTTRLNGCGSWFCVRRHAGGGGGSTGSDRTSETPPDRARTPSTDTYHGPGPSPGAGSYDDSIPPAKNCYRLVMLG